ncbi:glycosyltransferase family 4 protein [Patescibacteria group bacterium]|nr:glycosyltransferase family 4 protein [Patescibacteria group bacterium]MBU1612838.1 glycosyltransferase family 4 protein [Patescibacteria group bacterium]
MILYIDDKKRLVGGVCDNGADIRKLVACFMRVLSIGSDNSIFKSDSTFRKRVFNYAKLVDKYILVVPYHLEDKILLNGNIVVYGSGGHNKIIQLIKLYFKCCKAIEENSPDVITAQDPFEFGLVGWILKKKYWVGLNIQEHGDFYSKTYWRNENILSFIRYYIGYFILPRADSVRVVSERAKRTLMKKFHLSEDKIVKVPVFVDSTQKNFTKQDREEVLKGKFVFLTLARLEKQKNLPVMIRSFAEVVKKHQHAILIIVGRGSELEKLKSIVNELSLENYVIFREWTNDPGHYYQQADVYLLSSNYEGWGMVIIEAASFDLPIIMTDVGCANEVVKNRESGLVVPINDVKAFAVAMKETISDEGLRVKLTKNLVTELNNLPDFKATLSLYMSSWQKAKL